MASLDLQPAVAGSARKRKRASLLIDMTPMVDLGFLLISFFIFTAALTEEKGTALVVPKNGDPLPPVVKASHALSIMLTGSDRIVAYRGQLQQAVDRHSVVHTNWHVQNGIGQMIRTMQQELGENKGRLVLLIKPLPGASYRNVIDALDAPRSSARHGTRLA